MISEEIIIAQTQKWIYEVVIGLNFCPFAAKEVKQQKVLYEVAVQFQVENILHQLYTLLQKLDSNEASTAILIIPEGLESFNSYLQVLDMAEALVYESGYEGIYQIASFHPEYIFEGSHENDAANYTNRSPYPMFHILRENDLSEAVNKHSDTYKIPENNIAVAKKLGLEHMRQLRASCFNV